MNEIEKIKEINTALTEMVELIVAENPENRGLFVKNLVMGIVSKQATLHGDKLLFGNTEILLSQYVTEVYRWSRKGFSLLDGDLSLVTFDGKNSSAQFFPSYQKEIECYRNSIGKNCEINFMEICPKDEIIDSGNLAITIEKKEAYKRTLYKKRYGGNNFEGYAVTDNLSGIFVEVAIREDNNVKKFGTYVSKEEVDAATGKGLSYFYNAPTSRLTMYRKFAIRKLIRELKLRFGFDVPFFDTIEKDYYVNYSEVENGTNGETEEVVNETKTLPTPKKETLTDAKFKALKKRMEEGSATIEQAENYYEMTNEQKEALKALKAPENQDNSELTQTENIDLDKITQMWGS